MEAAGAILEQKYPEAQIGLRDGKYQIISPDKFTNLKDTPAEDIRLAQVALGDIKENVLKAQNIIFGSNKKGNIKISDSELKALDDVIKSEESEINHVLKRFGLSIGDLIKNPNILEDAITQKPVPKKAEGKAVELKAEPKPEAVKFHPEDAIKSAADSIETLRSQDVYRVLSETPAEYRYQVRAYITKNHSGNQRILDAVRKAMDELEGKTETKVIPTTKTAEKNVTTPKEQKAYVVDKAKDLLTAALARVRHELGADSWSDKDTEDYLKRYPGYSIINDESIEQITIDVPNDGRYKIPNRYDAFSKFFKNIKAMPTSTTPTELRTPKPSKKPTGKPIEQIEKEAAEEHQRYLDDRDNAKIEYEAAFKRLEGERKALNDWKEVERKIDDREIKRDIS